MYEQRINCKVENIFLYGSVSTSRNIIWAGPDPETITEKPYGLSSSQSIVYTLSMASVLEKTDAEFS